MLADTGLPAARGAGWLPVPAGPGLCHQATAFAEQGADWHSLFHDPELQTLIRSALVNNRDLRVAALNVEAFQAQYRIQRADLFPAVSATGAGSRQRVPGT